MPLIDDPTTDGLRNRGFIVNHVAERPPGAGGRTFIVTGLHRSGTSLVASVLQQAGLFIGADINEIVYEDEEIISALSSGDTAALRRIISGRDTNYRSWGFKLPMLCRDLDPDQLVLFNDPHLIVTFRDPVAMAVRTSLSEYQEPMGALREAIDDLNALSAFIGGVRCPSLLLSYEKALMFPHDFVDAIMHFCGIPRNDALRARLVSVVEPGRPSYIAGARRQYEGTIEGIMDGRLYGWCRLTHSTVPVPLEVLVDGQLVTSVVADAFRRDLLEAEGRHGGNHGFSIALEALRGGPDAAIRVRVAGQPIELGNSGRRLREFVSSA